MEFFKNMLSQLATNTGTIQRPVIGGMMGTVRRALASAWNDFVDFVFLAAHDFSPSEDQAEDREKSSSDDSDWDPSSHATNASGSFTSMSTTNKSTTNKSTTNKSTTNKSTTTNSHNTVHITIGSPNQSVLSSQTDLSAVTSILKVINDLANAPASTTPTTELDVVSPKQLESSLNSASAVATKSSTTSKSAISYTEGSTTMDSCNTCTHITADSYNGSLRTGSPARTPVQNAITEHLTELSISTIPATKDSSLDVVAQALMKQLESSLDSALAAASELSTTKITYTDHVTTAVRSLYETIIPSQHNQPTLPTTTPISPPPRTFARAAQSSKSTPAATSTTPTQVQSIPPTPLPAQNTAAPSISASKLTRYLRPRWCRPGTPPAKLNAARFTKDNHPTGRLQESTSCGTVE